MEVAHVRHSEGKRLVRKDTHAVFSDHVDHNELPDYHEIIKQLMEFGTVRSKLDEGLYSNLEELERKVMDDKIDEKEENERFKAPRTVLNDLESLLLEKSQVEQGEVRFCALRWAITLFDSQQCQSRFICMLGASDTKLDIREWLWRVYLLEKTKQDPQTEP